MVAVKGTHTQVPPRRPDDPGRDRPPKERSPREDTRRTPSATPPVFPGRGPFVGHPFLPERAQLYAGTWFCSSDPRRPSLTDVLSMRMHRPRAGPDETSL